MLISLSSITSLMVSYYTLENMKNLTEIIIFECFTDGQDSNAPDLSKRNSLDDAIPKQLVLLCSEKAVYVYSLTHIVQVTSALFM